MTARIAVLSGDGIGPEVVAAGREVLSAVEKRFGHTFLYTEAPVGGAALDQTGNPLPEKTLEVCRSADAVLLGAVGGPQWDGNPPALRPERGLLDLRAGLGLFCNLRPAVLYPALAARCPLREEVSGGAFDFVIVRELLGGLYYGARGRDGDRAFDTCVYTEQEIERVGRAAFQLAMSRRKKLSSVDKANVLETSRLWRNVMHRLKDEFPEVAYEDVLVDNAAMQLLRRPGSFDVIVTENMFGDILSDEAGMLTGSIGMLPSASLGAGSFGLYEPVHGSAPELSGTDTANPTATVLSCALLLRHSLGLLEEARAVERAALAALETPCRTADLAGASHIVTGTRAFGRLIAGLVG